MFSDTELRTVVRDDIFWLTFALAVADFIKFKHE